MAAEMGRMYLLWGWFPWWLSCSKWSPKLVYMRAAINGLSELCFIHTKKMKKMLWISEGVRRQGRDGEWVGWKSCKYSIHVWKFQKHKLKKNVIFLFPWWSGLWILTSRGQHALSIHSQSLLSGPQQNDKRQSDRDFKKRLHEWWKKLKVTGQI